MCGVCGEWMTSVELEKHRYYAHRGLDHISVRSAKLVALYTTPAGFVLVFLILFGGLDVSWLGFPLVLWAMLVFVILLVPVLVVPLKLSSEAYANAMFRCWVCDAYVPHRTLSQHLRQYHPGEGREFLLSQVLAGCIILSLPLGIMLPQVWRLVDPSLSWYLFLGPQIGAFSIAAVVAVYASHWPRRIARARTEWEATHQAA
jgi:hypothetical protein